MAKYKRFYFPSSGTPDVSPPFIGWDYTNYAQRRILTPIKTDTNLEDSHYIRYETIYSGSRLGFQFITQELPEQVVSAGTIRGAIILSPNNTYSNRLSIMVKICNNLGELIYTVVPFVYTVSRPGAISPRMFRNIEEIITYDNFYIPNKGRIIIEIGSNLTESYVVDTYLYRLRLGDKISAPDLLKWKPPLDDKLSSNPWIEFSSYINFTFGERIYGNPMSMLIW